MKPSFRDLRPWRGRSVLRLLGRSETARVASAESVFLAEVASGVGWRALAAVGSAAAAAFGCPADDASAAASAATPAAAAFEVLAVIGTCVKPLRVSLYFLPSLNFDYLKNVKLLD